MQGRVVGRWPTLAGELRAALIAEGEGVLATQVDALAVVELCGCGDRFCQSFYTAAKPTGSYGPGHRSVVLEPPWAGMLILDVVNDEIVFIEVIDRDALD